VKVLIVTQYFWPEVFLINDLVRGLQERGHKVTVLTGKPNYPNGSFFPGYGFLKPVREKYGRAEVLRVPLVPRGSGSGAALAINYLSFALFASLFGPLLCRGNYDVVFVYEPSPVTVGLPALVMKKVKKAPLMFWVQDLWPESLSAAGAVRSKRILDGVERMVRFIYRRCDLVLVQSRGFIGRVKDKATSSEVVYFPNWAEAVYEPVVVEDNALERDEMPSGFKVVYAGNIGAAQGFETVLDAAQRLRDYPEINWVLLGDGRRKRWIEGRVRELRLEDRVRLPGRRPMESMPRYFSLADALLVSLLRGEIFSLTVPTKIQSYLASGRPLIASLDGEGARVVEEAGAGLTAPAEDSEALAQAVLRMYETYTEEREEMGRRGRAYSEEHFERERLLDRLEGCMHQLVGGKR
jgi:glycosyltransferase involved in cell wall biosynthesis